MSLCTSTDSKVLGLPSATRPSRRDHGGKAGGTHAGTTSPSCSPPSSFLVRPCLPFLVQVLPSGLRGSFALSDSQLQSPWLISTHANKSGSSSVATWLLALRACLNRFLQRAYTWLVTRKGSRARLWNPEMVIYLQMSFQGETSTLFGTKDLALFTSEEMEVRRKRRKGKGGGRNLPRQSELLGLTTDYSNSSRKQNNIKEFYGIHS